MGTEIHVVLLSVIIIGGLGLCMLVFLVGFIIFSTIDFFRNKPDVENRHPWAALAKANELRFSPGFLGHFGNRITGVYRGYDLLLEFIPRKNTSVTKLTVFERNEKVQDLPDVYNLMLHKPVSLDDITNLLTPNGLPEELKGTIHTLNNGEVIRYEQIGKETDIDYLQSMFDLVSDIADGYPKVLSIGGEASVVLEELAKSNDPLHTVAFNILESIGRETTSRLKLKNGHLLCPHCFVYFSVHKPYFFWRSVTYYGCRNCRQSNAYIEVTGQIVAALDSRQDLKHWEQNGEYWVNWLKHRKMFDFDEVEIINATEEDVERFAVQIGNDTDRVRRNRYRQMNCRISTGCNLSPNALRILRRIFADVQN